MKLIHLARFCLIDDGPHGERLLAELNALPIGAAFCLKPDEAVFGRLRAMMPDVIVVNGSAMRHALAPGTGDRLRGLDDGMDPAGQSELADCPVILMLNAPKRADVYAAATGGYSAVLPMPTSARVLYRRTAALLQKTRRSSRSQQGEPVTG